MPYNPAQPDDTSVSRPSLRRSNPMMSAHDPHQSTVDAHFAQIHTPHWRDSAAARPKPVTSVPASPDSITVDGKKYDTGDWIAGGGYDNYKKSTTSAPATPTAPVPDKSKTGKWTNDEIYTGMDRNESNAFSGPIKDRGALRASDIARAGVAADSLNLLNSEVNKRRRALRAEADSLDTQ